MMPQEMAALPQPQRGRQIGLAAWPWRLPLLAVLAMGCVLFAGAAMVAYTDRTYTAQKIDQAEVQARILAFTVTAAVAFGDHQAMGEYLTALKANPEIESAGLYDAKGALLAQFARADNQAPPPPPGIGAPRLHGGVLDVSAPVLQDDTVIGTVALRATAEPMQHRLARWGVLALLVLLTLTVVTVLGLAQGALRRANAELEFRATALAHVNESLVGQIAQREQAEEALRQAQKMEAIGQLTGGVAHDFNNLLQVILSSIDRLARRLERGETVPAELLRLAEPAMRAARRAATLTQRLLAFSRRQPLAPQALDVNKLVVGMSDLLSRTLGETIRTETVLAGGLWRIYADENQLESALLNLAVNARDAMPEGGKLTIETANAWLDEAYARSRDEVRPGQYVLVAVSDTGTGMSRDILERVFEPFFTTKDIGHGTGLGLSQVYGFVKQSGGHVAIYSEPGQGTCVKLYLPRLVNPPVEAELAEAQPAPPGATRQEVVLVVEDEPDVREATAAALRELGYEVLAVADGHLALEILRSPQRIDLLFTDVGLPGGLNGRQLANAARPLRPELKVLFTTGYARNAIVHHGRLDPGVALIGKPFSDAELAFKLRVVLDAGGAAQPAASSTPSGPAPAS